MTSNFADALATQFFNAALTIFAVTTLGFGATAIGALNAIGSLAFLVLTIPIGLVVDRLGAGRALLGSLSLKLALLMTSGILLVLGQFNAVAVFGLAFALGVAALSTETAQIAIVPSIVRGGDAIKALASKMSVWDRVAAVGAPLLAGLALHIWSFSAISWTSAALILGSVVAAAILVRKSRVGSTATPEQATDTTPRGKRAIIADALQGFKVLQSDSILLGSTVLVAVGNMGLALGSAVDAVLVLRHLELGPQFYGLLGSLGAGAGIVASLVAVRLTSSWSLKKLFGWGAILQAAIAVLPLAAFLVPSAGAVLMLMFSVLWDAVITITNIAGFAYVASATDPQALGRTSSARRLVTMGAVPVAGIAGGYLADSAGLALPLIIWPVGTLIAALVYFRLVSSGRGPGGR